MPQLPRLAKFIINGLVATGVHFAVLWINLHWLGFRSAGLASFAAALVGISVSFLGNRYFVFNAAEAPALPQFGRFAALYAFAAVIHGATLYGWTDLSGLDYRAGFLLATAMQFAISYSGSQMLVFKPAQPSGDEASQ
ncbi:MAG: GtrA family protein [Pseudoxanthomonas sp.]